MDDVLAGGRARSVVGVLDDSAVADTLLAKLADLGIGTEDVTVMTRDGASRQNALFDPRSSLISGGAATGAAFGGLLGGLAGWMVSIGALAIPGVLVPGVGLVFGAGTLASLLTGIAVGAAAGGLIGALLGIGVPEDEAKQYEQSLTSGRTLVTAHLPDGVHEQPVVAAFEESGAYDVRVYETPAREAVAATRPVHARSIVEEPENGEPAPHEASTMGPVEDYLPVGEASAHTDALGSGAEGGLGTGVPVGEPPAPEEAEPADEGRIDRTGSGEVDVMKEDENSPGA